MLHFARNGKVSFLYDRSSLSFVFNQPYKNNQYHFNLGKFTVRKFRLILFFLTQKIFSSVSSGLNTMTDKQILLYKASSPLDLVSYIVQYSNDFKRSHQGHLDSEDCCVEGE